VVTAISLDPGILAPLAGVAHKSLADNLPAMGLLHLCWACSRAVRSARACRTGLRPERREWWLPIIGRSRRSRGRCGRQHMTFRPVRDRWLSVVAICF